MFLKSKTNSAYMKKLNNDPGFRQFVEFIEKNYICIIEGNEAMKESVFQKALVGAWKKLLHQSRFLEADVKSYIRQGKLTLEGFTKKGGCVRFFFGADIRDGLRTLFQNHVTSKWGSNQYSTRVQSVALEQDHFKGWWGVTRLRCYPWSQPQVSDF